MLEVHRTRLFEAYQNDKLEINRTHMLEAH